MLSALAFNLRAPARRVLTPARALSAASADATAVKTKKRRRKKKPVAEHVPVEVPVNVWAGQSNPVTKPDAEYPEWLWTLTDPLPSLRDMSAVPWEEFSDKDKRRASRLAHRAKMEKRKEARLARGL
jgi:large subunit ribosomal protein L54